MENQLTKTETNDKLNVLNLLDDTQLAKAEIFLKKIMATEKGGIKSVNEGLAILMRAQDLNLPFSTCIEHVHVINGKTGIDIHIIKALLVKGEVLWECTKDYEPQYQYTDGDNIYLETQLPSYCIKCKNQKEAEEKTTDDIIGVYPLKWYIDLNGNKLNEMQLNDKCIIALNKIQAVKFAKEGKYPVIRTNAQPVDFVTEYKFTRYRNIYNTIHEQTCISRFSFSEAQMADLFSKDTYKKYPKTLISHRAFTLGARDIASDLLMGCMETTELKIVNNKDISDNDVIDDSNNYEVID